MPKYCMNLDFRGWFEARRAATVHPEIKKWIDSADKLKQTMEKIKYLMKDKETNKKPDFSTIRPIDFEKLDSKFKKEPDKPEDKPDDKEKIEPKNVKKPTKVEKDKESDEEKGSQDDKKDKRFDVQRRPATS